MSKKHQFKTEVQSLLDLVIHSLYSNQEIFLRELISNASDAIDRARFESQKDQSILEDDPEWKIKLIPDTAAGTLTIQDNGIGMSAEEVEANIGTVANSGTKKFLQQLKDSKEPLSPELIGQFGVGFYSAFMVADEVTVLTRRAGAKDSATRWSSKGDGYYTIEPATREHRGTDIILHLLPDAKEYLEEWRLRKIVSKYSDFVEHPICMDIRREEEERDADGKKIEGAEPKVTITEETLYSRKAIWLRDKNEIKPEEYKEFYHHVSHDFQEPFETMHWSVEGQSEFRALVYIPAKPVMDMFIPDQKDKGLQLYVHRVFITDNCEELCPKYLRFLRGVVDSADLPLNVSREMLQEDRNLKIIRKNITKKTLDTLADIKDKQPERYSEFWDSFGDVFKFGLREDFENSAKIRDLLMYESSGTEKGKRTSLADYVKRMPDSQKSIYYLTAESRASAENNPQLEAFKSRGYEVLFMTDPIDEWVVGDLGEYEGKKLQAINKGDIDLDTEEEKKANEEKRKQAETDNKDLVAKIKEILGDRVKEVRLSHRLTESACCLADDEWGIGANMEKLLKAMKQDVPPARRILELNPEHPLITALRQLLEKDAANPKIEEYTKLLYNQALLLAQLPIEDPLVFTRNLSNIMAQSLN